MIKINFLIIVTFLALLLVLKIKINTKNFKVKSKIENYTTNNKYYHHIPYHQNPRMWHRYDNQWNELYGTQMRDLESNRNKLKKNQTRQCSEFKIHGLKVTDRKWLTHKGKFNWDKWISPVIEGKYDYDYNNRVKPHQMFY